MTIFEFLMLAAITCSVLGEKSQAEHKSSKDDKKLDKISLLSVKKTVPNGKSKEDPILFDGIFGSNKKGPEGIQYKSILHAAKQHIAMRGQQQVSNAGRKMMVGKKYHPAPKERK